MTQFLHNSVQQMSLYLGKEGLKLTWIWGVQKMQEYFYVQLSSGILMQIHRVIERQRALVNNGVSLVIRRKTQSLTYPGLLTL